MDYGDVARGNYIAGTAQRWFTAKCDQYWARYSPEQLAEQQESLKRLLLCRDVCALIYSYIKPPELWNLVRVSHEFSQAFNTEQCARERWLKLHYGKQSIMTRIDTEGPRKRKLTSRYTKGIPSWVPQQGIPYKKYVFLWKQIRKRGKEKLQCIEWLLE